MKSFQGLLKKIATPICQQYGFVTATVLIDWRLIVGEQFASICQAQKMTFPPHKRNNGCLYVATSSGFAPELSYLEPLIIDRINKYFGYQAVKRIIITHKNIKLGSETPLTQKKPLSLEDKKQIETCIQNIENEELKITLRNLGVGIFQKNIP